MAEQDNKTTLPKQAGKEIGHSGTLIFQGYINNEDYNSTFSGPRLIEAVEVMRRSSSTVRATLLVVKLPILSADWDIKAAVNQEGEVEDADQEKADFIKRELFKRNINFFNFLREGSTALEFGFSVFEKVLELTDFNGEPRIGLSNLAFRKQKSIAKWEMNDGQPGVHQLVGDGKQFDIPRAKLVIFTNEKEGENHAGISLLRYAYKDWDILDKLQIVNAVALEKMSIGIPIVSAKDPTVSPAPTDVTKAEEILRNFRANEEGYLSIPATMTVEMLDMRASTTKEIIPTLQYHDRRISQAILAQFMDLGGQSGSGSQSLSKDLTSLFMKAEEATARQFASTIQEDIINQLINLNYADNPNGYPQITFGQISDDDLESTANSLGTLAEKQLITPDIDIETHLRKKYSLPAMSEETRELYEKKQEMAENAPTPQDDSTTKPSNNMDDAENDMPKNGKKTKANPEDVKASLEAAQARARAAKKDLIDAITS